MFISHPQDIIADFRLGRFVIMVDSPNRENEGDIMFAAEFADAAKINFLIREARGLVCLALTEDQVKRLRLPKIHSDLHSSHQNHAAFTFSIEAKSGINTGISARERAHTIQTAINSSATGEEIVVPGHVFPLESRNGGVLVRPGHTEAAVDLARLAGVGTSGVICEVLDDLGEAAKGDYLAQFSEKHKIRIGTIEDLIVYIKEKSGL